ncbi:MAG TPA: hypothetical protein VFW98_07945 [Gemmatimonadaceae bacterium]|nr:hypothetical protein [Gemmatimonadaceae bacterium]
MRIRAAAVCLLLLLGACHHSSNAQRAIAHPDPNVITAEEIRKSNESTAYAVIQALRPNMLTARGRSGAVVVFLDNQPFGDLGSLQGLSSLGIEEIRYLSPSEARGEYGPAYSGGVIAITSKR